MTTNMNQQTETLQQNKQVMAAIWEALGRKDLDAVRECYHPDAVYYAPIGALEGREAIVDYFRNYLAAFPDFKGEVERILAEGDLVAHQARVRGTNEGDFMGIPATNKFVTSTGMLLSRMKDGQIVEEWESFDYSDIMRQLGLG
jgi:steroid delta-isomerase-like uncharacterized protein